MASKVLSAGAVVLSLLSDSVYGDKATATFGGDNGITGTVSVDAGTVTISLDVTDLAGDDYDGVTDGATCFEGGLKYHIHTDWLHNMTTDYLGSTLCGGSYTGGHWDPWLACGSATDNEYCDGKTASGCVTGSSALADNTDDTYSCSSDNYADNAYSCEVGDWNGKYGLLELDSDLMMEMTASSSFEVDGSDVMGMSIVFHCNGGARAFCAPFEDDGASTEDRVAQVGSDAMGAIFDDTGNNSVIFLQNGLTFMALDYGLLTFPDSGCDTLEARVYNEWNHDDDTFFSFDDCGSDMVGMFYDPTVSCAPDSDSSFCSDDTICNATSSMFEYECDYSSATDRYLCAPGDLTGKYGSLDVSDGMAEWFQVDELQIDLDLLTGKSIVFQCSDTWEILACAGVFDNNTLTTEVDMNKDSANSLSHTSIFFTFAIAMLATIIVYTN